MRRKSRVRRVRRRTVESQLRDDQKSDKAAAEQAIRENPLCEYPTGWTAAVARELFAGDDMVTYADHPEFDPEAPEHGDLISKSMEYAKANPGWKEHDLREHLLEDFPADQVAANWDDCLEAAEHYTDGTP